MSVASSHQYPDMSWNIQHVQKAPFPHTCFIIVHSGESFFKKASFLGGGECWLGADERPQQRDGKYIHMSADMA